MATSDTWTMVDALAQAATALLAAFGILFAWRQIEAGRKQHQEQIAYDAYKEWLGLGRELFNLAGPRKGMVTFEGLSVKFMGNESEGEKYTWVVASMLVAFEQVLRAFPSDKTWRKAILYDLLWHTPYFSSDFFRGIGNAPDHLSIYSLGLQKLILEAIQAGHPETITPQMAAE